MPSAPLRPGIAPSDLNETFLRRVLTRHAIPFSVTEDNEVLASLTHPIFLLPHTDGILTLMVLYAWGDEARRRDRLRFLNRLNESFVLIKAFDSADRLVLSHDLWISERLSPEDLVTALQLFDETVDEILDDIPPGIVQSALVSRKLETAGRGTGWRRRSAFASER